MSITTSDGPLAGRFEPKYNVSATRPRSGTTQKFSPGTPTIGRDQATPLEALVAGRKGCALAKTDPLPPVRSPRALVWREIRIKYVPFLVFAVIVVLIVCLWGKYVAVPQRLSEPATQPAESYSRTPK